MKEVGAFEAKTRFGQLLDQVEAGDEIVITRRGKIVARLVPPAGAVDREAGAQAAARIRARRRGVRLGGLKIKALIAEGRL
jgi:prevent-host-death family protein